MTDRDDILDLAIREACLLAQQSPELPQPSGADPEDDVLLRLLDGGQPSAETQTLSQQVKDSPYARERLVTLTEALSDADATPPVPSVVNRFNDKAITAQSPARLSFVWARGCLRYLWGTLEPRSLEAVPVATRSGTFKRPQEETSFFAMKRPLSRPPSTIMSI